jgi:hypothetical protein
VGYIGCRNRHDERVVGRKRGRAGRSHGSSLPMPLWWIVEAEMMIGRKDGFVRLRRCVTAIDTGDLGVSCETDTVNRYTIAHLRSREYQRFVKE